MVIVLRNTGRTKGVGFDQISPGSQILLVNFLNDVGLRQGQ